MLCGCSVRLQQYRLLQTDGSKAAVALVTVAVWRAWRQRAAHCKSPGGFPEPRSVGSLWWAAAGSPLGAQILPPGSVHFLFVHLLGCVNGAARRFGVEGGLVWYWWMCGKVPPFYSALWLDWSNGTKMQWTQCCHGSWALIGERPALSGDLTPALWLSGLRPWTDGLGSGLGADSKDTPTDAQSLHLFSI